MKTAVRIFIAGLFLPTISLRAEPVRDKCDSSLRIVYPNIGIILSIGYGQDHLKKIDPRTFKFTEGSPLCIDEIQKHGAQLELLHGGGFGGDQYITSLRQEKKVLVIEQLKNPKSSVTYPFLQWQISCAREPCEISPPTCLLNLPKSVDSRAKIKMLLMRKTMLPGHGADLGDIDEFSDMAKGLLIESLAGDTESKQLLMDRSFSAEGVYDELLQAARGTYLRAQTLHCPAPPGAPKKPKPAKPVKKSSTKKRKHK